VVVVKRKIALTLTVLLGTATVAAAASSPAVKTGSATSIKDTSAVLNGTINPNGAKTTYWFEWGLTSSYGSISAVHTLNAGTKAVSVHVTAAGLSPDVHYHYRLFAQNSSGTSSGADHTFKTTGHPVPVAQTEPASSITTSSAIISGLVDPNGQSTPTEFQWGSSPSSLTNTVPGPTVAATTPLQTIATQLSLLAPGATFYYRVLVHSVVGWLPAATLSFTTIPLSRPYASLHVATAPRRDSHKPFTFTTYGSISGPYPANAQCTGTVAIRYFAAGRQIKLRFATVQPNCTFVEQTTISHTHAAHRGAPRPRVQQLQLHINFRGNSYLAPKRHDESVTMG
jgi:phosphodiesterase/alkaline phosphatase D-like protein